MPFKDDTKRFTFTHKAEYLFTFLYNGFALRRILFSLCSFVIMSVSR